MDIIHVSSLIRKRKIKFKKKDPEILEKTKIRLTRLATRSTEKAVNLKNSKFSGVIVCSLCG